MPRYRVTGPDGGTFEVNAPDGATEADVMAYVQQNAQPRQPAAPSMSAGEIAGDVAKSAGIGLAQGAIGIGTLPGNIEQLGRLGINKGAELLGYEAPVSSGTFLPNYGDVKGEIEKHTGEFYKPKTVAGEYARTIGEFAPMAATGGAGVVGRVANVVAPAFMSETFGQVTKGTPAEPYARVAGAFAGGTIPRAVTPLPADAARAGHLATLEKEGVKSLTAGQKTGSPALRWTESVTKDTPGGGGKVAAMETQASEELTRAAFKQAGVDTRRAPPEVIDKAFTDLGKKFDDLGKSTAVRVDRALSKDFAAAIDDYNSLVPETLRAPYIQKAAHDIMTMSHGRPIPGEVYQAVRSRVEKMRRSTTDAQLSGPDGALTRMRDALDDAMERSLSKQKGGAEVAKQWREVRKQYKNLLVLERAMSGAGSDALNGLISPAALRTAAKVKGKRAYSRGKDDLGELARAAAEVMKPLPQSGTAPRAAASAILGVGATAATGGNFLAGLAAAASEPALRAAMSRIVTSKPVQNWMANQRAAGYLAERPGRANAMVVPEILAEHGGLVGRQTTGPYPPGDPRWRDDSKR
jgi:hypothetical protein